LIRRIKIGYFRLSAEILGNGRSIPVPWYPDPLFDLPSNFPTKFSKDKKINRKSKKQSITVPDFDPKQQKTWNYLISGAVKTRDLHSV
jgi:hypothetical protein